MKQSKWMFLLLLMMITGYARSLAVQGDGNSAQ